MATTMRYDMPLRDAPKSARWSDPNTRKMRGTTLHKQIVVCIDGVKELTIRSIGNGEGVARGIGQIRQLAGLQGCWIAYGVDFQEALAKISGV